MQEIPAIQRSQQGCARHSKIEDSDDSSRAQYAMHFPKSPVDIRQIPQHKCRNHNIKGILGKGEFEGICAQEKNTPAYAVPRKFPGAHSKHRLAEIAPHDGPEPGKSERKICGTASHIQNSGIRSPNPSFRFPDTGFSPAPVDIRREEVIQEIVPVRNRSKHIPDAA
jgi:hypothetical protein